MKSLKLYKQTVKITTSDELKAVLPENFKGFCILEYQDENRLIFSGHIKNEDDIYSDKLLKLSCFNENSFINIEKTCKGEFNIVTDMNLLETPAESIEFCGDPEIEEFVLWGKYSELAESHFESLIPIVFNYPVDGKKKRVLIKATKYKDHFGHTLFYKYNSLKGHDL